MNNDRISIVMITRNRGNRIRFTLERLLDLPELPRLIVVDNGSTDETVEVARSLGPRVEVRALGRNLGCAGRNLGVMRAMTPYVAFSDDDSWWQPGALSRAADIFDARPSLGLLAARILVGPEERMDPLSIAMATSPLADGYQNDRQAVGVPIAGFAACSAVVRRSAFLEAGGFEQRFGVGGEEQVLALDLMRNGWRLSYVDELVAHHHPSPVRDPKKRRRHEVRNALWTAWLRRPLASVWTATWRILKSSLRDPARCAGVGDALTEISWVFRERKPVPVEIDRRLQIAERAWMASIRSV